MAPKFDCFVIFAEMRTGSNFLETNLNALPGLSCLGEAFNPHFIGYPNRSAILGVTQTQRDRDPGRLLEAIRNGAGGLRGFRFFHDHDPRILDRVLDDPRCAKIVLTRNPLDSYVSWKIAQATGQWKLTDVGRRRSARARFDAAEFGAFLEAIQDFRARINERLQCSGQVAFRLGYEDLQSLEVMNGLAAWLGRPDRLPALDQSLKQQNPGPVTDKVANPEEMQEALAGFDPFGIDRMPGAEPRRGPMVPRYVAGLRSPLLFMPIPGGSAGRVLRWLAGLDGVAETALPTGMTQKTLHDWKDSHPGHRSFTVLRHPLARAHAVFCARLLGSGPEARPKLRASLRRRFDLPLPEGDAGPEYPAEDHRAAFEGFLRLIKSSLAGQSGFRADPDWVSQAQIVAGFCDVAPPDHILREEELHAALPALADSATGTGGPSFHGAAAEGSWPLSRIHDAALDRLAADVYRRDYAMFGFGAWSGNGS